MKTQLQKITYILESEGSISRNRCISMYITRLAARIDDLERMGWKFRHEKDGNDYRYYVEDMPLPKQLTFAELQK